VAAQEFWPRPLEGPGDRLEDDTEHHVDLQPPPAEDVAQAFLAQALALKTTADVTTVDGGNIAAALR